MVIGVPREIKTAENRIALVPAGAEVLVEAGHTVYLERCAGQGSGFDDTDFAAAGARVLDGAAEVWAKDLEKVHGGRGVLLGGVPGVAPAEVVILGGGVVGINAAKMAGGVGASVTILDLSLDRLRYLSDVLPANVKTVYSNRYNILG